MNINKRIVIFITGVSGSGKSTIGALLSEHTGYPFFDGDDYHPAGNKRKMASGIALNDEDRKDWLIKLNAIAAGEIQKGSCIIACSALKGSYRDTLVKGIEKYCRFVFLEGDYHQILERVSKRHGHFMPPSLLQSQFETLEVPHEALKINIGERPDQIVAEIIDQLLNRSEFGLIGLGVMGKALCRNLSRNNFSISMYNQHVPGKEENVAVNFKKDHPELQNARAFDVLSDFVNSLQQPRKIMLMISSGKAVDSIIDSLLPLLSPFDIIIDGGNSHYEDTNRRGKKLSDQNILFSGCGISGGEEGALNGPAIMPGGEPATYRAIKPFLESIAAKDKNGHPCCNLTGPEGSGHFVKMVHNGIEYAEMQLLAEVYHILKQTKDNDEIADILETWKERTGSFLLDITILILRKKENGLSLIDKILDKADNKGTGNWATVASAGLGIPSTMMATSLFARYISSFKVLRKEMESVLKHEIKSVEINTQSLMAAYYIARIINHYQGFELMKEASVRYRWNLNLSEIARIWTNGCIIRSTLMDELSYVLKTNQNILNHPLFYNFINENKTEMISVIAGCIQSEIAIPALSDSLNFINGLATANSAANLIQAQRDHFGAHTYRRNDDGGNIVHHTNWKENL